MCFHPLQVHKGNREASACPRHVTQPLLVAAWGPAGAGWEGGIPTSAQAASSTALLLGRDAPGTASHPTGFVVAEPDPNVGYYL